jgi:NifU-like protein
VPIYPENIANLIRSPKYCGAIEQPDATGTEAKFDCGCFIRFEIQVTGELPAVGKIRYQTNGCGFMASAAERLASAVYGLPLIELGASFDPQLEYDQGRSACISVVVNALKAAFADHRARKIEEFRGEKPLICTCFGVSEETVEEFVRTARPADVGEVTRHLRAGGGCGSCTLLIRDIIEGFEA